MKNMRWFALVLALCLALVLCSCGLQPFREEVRGSGVIVTREVALPDSGVALRLDDISFQFSSRSIGSVDMTVVIDESLDRAAVLETDNNILTWMRLAYDSVKGELTLSAPPTMAFSPTKLKLTVGAPVRELAIDGLWEISYDCPSVKSCKLTVDGTADGDFIFGALDSLDMRFSGLSTAVMNCESVRECKLVADGSLDGDFAFGAVDRLDMNFGGLSTAGVDCESVRECKLVADGSLDGDFAFGEADSLDVVLGGLGTITVSGTARRAAFELEGGGSIRAFGLTAQDASVTISGLGDCEITAGQSLNAVIEGGGDITYAGSPAVTQRVDGLGRIKAR